MSSNNIEHEESDALIVDAQKPIASGSNVSDTQLYGELEDTPNGEGEIWEVYDTPADKNAEFSVLIQSLCILIAFVSGISIVLQTALSVVLADVCENAHFSNFFKFISATVMILLCSLIDFNNSISSAQKTGYFFVNNVDHEHLNHPIMEESPIVRSQPWMFVYLAGVLRAVGFVLIVFASQVAGYTISMVLFVTCLLTVSLLMDHFGWLGSPIRYFNWFKLLGTLLLVGGTIYINVQMYKLKTDIASPGLFAAACICGFLGGGFFVISGAMNRVLAVVTGSYMFSTFVTVSVGSVFLIIVWGISTAIGETTIYSPLVEAEYWYLWMAAPAVLFPVIAASLAPPVIGYAFYYAVVVIGLIFFSVLLDTLHILMPSHAVPVFADTSIVVILAGLIMILVGVILTRIEYNFSCVALWTCCCKKTPEKRKSVSAPAAPTEPSSN